ncbi:MULTISPECIES: phage tail tube protein [Pseudomonas]|uniref:phage tail tube protein n=1 Tax=Pseudomonas TaxID=286 RepID=UPI0005EBB66A|nr:MULTISPECIES: phage tail tube protein [Pseudomonas]KJK14887.1 phage tail protein [Pseudomonas sp. 2(2015)]UVL26237.1 phage tail tube protein [Pseudomonas donghuensis]
MGQKVAGTCYVKADGEQLTITGGVECPLSDKKRETITRGFYKEEDLVPYISVDAVKTPNFPRAKLANATNMTITAELADGSSYVLSGAYLVDETKVTGDDAKVALKFEGIAGDWQ